MTRVTDTITWVLDLVIVSSINWILSTLGLEGLRIRWDMMWEGVFSFFRGIENGINSTFNNGVGSLNEGLDSVTGGVLSSFADGLGDASSTIGSLISWIRDLQGNMFSDGVVDASSIPGYTQLNNPPSAIPDSLLAPVNSILAAIDGIVFLINVVFEFLGFLLSIPAILFGTPLVWILTPLQSLLNSVEFVFNTQATVLDFVFILIGMLLILFFVLRAIGELTSPFSLILSPIRSIKTVTSTIPLLLVGGLLILYGLSNVVGGALLLGLGLLIIVWGQTSDSGKVFTLGLLSFTVGVPAFLFAIGFGFVAVIVFGFAIIGLTLFTLDYLTDDVAEQIDQGSSISEAILP